MRRWPAALACALTLALAGCGSLPGGVDGDITGGWAPMPAAKQFRPVEGSCHAAITDTGAQQNYEETACAGPHKAETIAVFDLAKTTATAPEDALDEAFAQCSRRADAWLGADWRTGWVVIQPVVPAGNAWSGGARWVRCDVAETSPVDGTLVSRSGSMKGGLKPGGDLVMSCANATLKNDRVTELHPVACAGKHTAEFAGLFVSKRDSSADVTDKELEKGCDAAIAKFAGVPDDSNLQYRVGWLGFPPDDTAWDLGDHAIRCFLWVNGEKLTGSYRNGGSRKLPIRYA